MALNVSTNALKAEVMNSSPSKRWNLLVIDSNLESIRYLQDILQNGPYHIISTNDGEEGFNLLLQEPARFAAIILGHEIQSINGVRLVHKITSCSTLKTLPVIMEACTGTIEEMEICIRAGARYYIPRPIDKALLPQVIDTAIRDQERYRSAEQSIWLTKPINSLYQAEFRLRTLSEAQTVASLIANECPNPRLAVVGIIEILINAIEHGNLNISYEEKTTLHQDNRWLEEIEHRLQMPEYADKVVTVLFKKTDAHINIRVTDQGNGFNWRLYQTLDANRVFDNHGRGILMAQNLAFETLIYHGSGNDVECIIPLAL